MFNRKKPTPNELHIKEAEDKRDTLLSDAFEAVISVDALKDEQDAAKDEIIRQYREAEKRR